LAESRYSAWMNCELPSQQKLDSLDFNQLEMPGVYLIFAGEIPVYVGETGNVALRVKTVRDVQSWQNLDPSHITVIPPVHFKSADKHAIQSVLAKRTRSVLNTKLIIAD